MNPADPRAPGRRPPGAATDFSDASRGGFGSKPWGDSSRSADRSGPRGDPRSPFGSSRWEGAPAYTPPDEIEEEDDEKEKPTGRRRRSSGPTHTRRTLAALGGSVDLVRDAQGVAHVFAKSERDAYAALGFAMTEDRLWQMDLARRIATGRSAELLGDAATRRDALVRTVGIPRRAAASASRLDGTARDVLAAFAGGVNAARVLAKPAECARLGYEVEPWTVADSLAIELYLAWCRASMVWPSKILVARAWATGGVERARWLTGTGDDAGSNGGDRLGLWRRIDPRLVDLADLVPQGVPGGHAVALGLGRTGGAGALAASIELPVIAPSAVYPVALAAPGFRVVGLAHLGMPALIAGRNDELAWSATPVHVDDVDCVMEELDGIGAFRTEAGWEKLARRKEVVRVRDGEACRIEVAETRNGPLLSHLVEQLDGPLEGLRPVAVALRWGANSLGTALPGLLAMARATKAADARSAASLLDRSPVPLELTVADRSGALASVLAGARPVRKSGAVCPVRGWISEARWEGLEPLSARSRPEPRDACFAGATAESACPRVLEARRSRLAHLVAGASSADALATIGKDAFDEAARVMLPAIRSALADAAADRVGRVRELMDVWTGEAEAGSAAAAAFYVALPELVRTLFPDGRFGSIERCPEVAVGAVMRRLAADDADSDACRGPVVAAFEKAERWLCERLGSETRTWSWGALHTVAVRSPAPDPEAAAAEPLPVAGSLGTVLGHRSGLAGPPFEVVVAPAASLVAELSTDVLRIEGSGPAEPLVLRLGERPPGERVELVAG